MKESNEIFELCKRVYKATGWDGTEKFWHSLISHDMKKWSDYKLQDYRPDSLFGIRIVPLYTSDYLLERLPSVVQDPYDKIFRHIQMWINGDRSAHAGYVEPYAHDDRVAYAQKSDEMRITLLKLTIKLHEEGLL